MARGFQAHPPLAAPLPSPSQAPGAPWVRLLSPPLGPSRLRRGAQSRGLRERREGKGRGGKGRRRKGDDPSKGGCGVSALDPRARLRAPSRRPSPSCSSPTSRRTSRWSASLPPRSFRLPVTPPLSPASPAPLGFPFISPTSVFPLVGSTLPPPFWGPPRSLSARLAWPPQGWPAGALELTDSSPGEGT